MDWALVAFSVAIKHYALSLLPVEAAFIVGCLMDYRHLMRYPVIYLPACPILSGSFLAKIFGLDGPVAEYYPNTDTIWYHFFVQRKFSDPPPRPIAPWSPWFDSDEDVPYYDAPTPGTSMFKNILANRFLPLMPSGISLVLMAGLSLVLISILIGFFVSGALRPVAAQSERVLKDDAVEARRSSVQWPVPLCIVAALVLGRTSVSPGLFEEMRDTIVFISALAVLATASLKVSKVLDVDGYLPYVGRSQLLRASYVAARQHGPCHTPTGSSSVTDTVGVLSGPLVVDPESAIDETKANGERKDTPRPDSVDSHLTGPFESVTGNEAATIDMKMLADAVVRTTKRESGMPAELASVPIPNDHDKLAPLVTTPLDICGTTTPEAGKRAGSNESFPLDGDAGTISSPSLPPSESVEDPDSHSHPTTNITSGKSKKKGKKPGSRRKASDSALPVRTLKHVAVSPDKYPALQDLA
ncbi:hypothetical protein ACEPAF_5544 [Sanghuangporus sanghuang]